VKVCCLSILLAQVRQVCSVRWRLEACWFVARQGHNTTLTSMLPKNTQRGQWTLLCCSASESSTRLPKHNLVPMGLRAAETRQTHRTHSLDLARPTARPPPFAFFTTEALHPEYPLQDKHKLLSASASFWFLPLRPTKAVSFHSSPPPS
jgi:hypothetical protein